MNFDLTKVCADCPFRSDRPPFISAARVREILGDPAGRGRKGFPADAFTCHKTIDYDTDDGRPRYRKNSQHCVGAALILSRDDMPNTAMQLAMRLLRWNPEQLDHAAPVYSSRAACIAAHDAAERFRSSKRD